MNDKDRIKMLKLLRTAKKTLEFFSNQSNRDLFLEHKFAGYIGLSQDIKDAIDFAESYEYEN